MGSGDAKICVLRPLDIISTVFDVATSPFVGGGEGISRVSMGSQGPFPSLAKPKASSDCIDLRKLWPWLESLLGDMALGRDAVVVGEGGPPPSSHNSISPTEESAILMRHALFSKTTKRDSCDPYVWSPGVDKRRARGLLITGLS
jgi:hypothetical protein